MDDALPGLIEVEHPDAAADVSVRNAANSSHPVLIVPARPDAVEIA